MTYDEIEARINEIKTIAQGGDDEEAHSMQDKLFLDFIKYVEKHPDDKDIAYMAGAVLWVEKIEFSRWYA